MQSQTAYSEVAPKTPGIFSSGAVGQPASKRFAYLNAGDDESYDEAVKLAAYVCGTPAAILSFKHRSRQWLIASFGIDALECPRALLFSAQATRVPDRITVVPDVAEDPRFAHDRDQADGMTFRFYAGAPLVSPHGSAFGTISVIDRASRVLTDAQASALGSLARQIVRELALGQENIALRLANARLAEISMTDALTCIPNRRAFNERLAAEELRARQTGEPFSLLLMDVDHFKLFNDHYGHLAGDEALFRIATTLKRNNRAADMLARYGGEEFALILPKTSIEAAAAVAERLRRAIETVRLPWQGLTLSIGAAAYDLAGGSYDLITAADGALYAAKAAGRNGVVVATPQASRNG